MGYATLQPMQTAPLHPLEAPVLTPPWRSPAAVQTTHATVEVMTAVEDDMQRRMFSGCVLV